jgi:DNA-binding NarL/FixJ family response regulator
MSGTASNIGVMIVDDHDLVRRGFASLLSSQQGITVVAEASSGEAAIDHCREHHEDIDVILMDVNMPGIGGMEAIKQIIAKDPAAKIVVVSSLGGAQDKLLEALEAGALSVVSKPFDDDKAVGVFKKLLGI